jgi:hypothetical protein
MATLAVIADTHLPRGSRELPTSCVERRQAATDGDSRGLVIK